MYLGSKGSYKTTSKNVTDMLDPAAITFVILRATEAVLIIVGNSLAIFVFWTQTFRQRRACLLLINLSAADLLVGVAESLFLATKKIQTWGQEGDAKYPLLSFRLFASCASVLFLALISLVRVCAVLWPVRHRVTSLHIYVCSIVTVWFIGLVFVITVFQGSESGLRFSYHLYLPFCFLSCYLYQLY